MASGKVDKFLRIKPYDDQGVEITGLTSGQTKKIEIPEDGYYMVRLLNRDAGGQIGYQVLFNRTGIAPIVAGSNNYAEWTYFTSPPIPLRKGDIVYVASTFRHMGHFMRISD